MGIKSNVFLNIGYLSMKMKRTRRMKSAKKISQTLQIFSGIASYQLQAQNLLWISDSSTTRINHFDLQSLTYPIQSAAKNHYL